MPITHVAIKYESGIICLPKPYRHHDVIRQHWEYTKEATRGSDEQGFMYEAPTGQLIFLDRETAAIIAIRNKQIKQLKWPPFLYSEDLW